MLGFNIAYYPGRIAKRKVLVYFWIERLSVIIHYGRKRSTTRVSSNHFYWLFKGAGY